MWIFLLILAVPLIEIGLFVTLGSAIGLWPTLAWVLFSAALGLFVLKRVALSGAVSLSRDMREMGDPLSPLAHRVMLVMAGGLLLLPGFMTDALGLLLLLKPVRLGVIALIARRIRVVPVHTPSTADAIEGDWSEVEDDALPPRRDQGSGWTRH
jgi:UPF0716 protein FxsA